MSFKRLVQSVKYAFRGLRFTFKTEQNFRIQCFAGVLVMVLAFVLGLQIWEKVAVLMFIILVLLMEILNTALEYFTDLLKPRLHHYVYKIKDIMAGGVFLSVLGAILVGLVIFVPYFVNLFK